MTFMRPMSDPSPVLSPDSLPDRLADPVWVSHHPLLEGLDPAARDRVRAAFDRQPLAPDDPLPTGVGGRAPVAMVRQGALAEYVPDKRGGVHLFGLVLPGELVAPSGPRLPQRRLKALGDTEVLLCEAAAFDALQSEVPRLPVNLLWIAQTQLRQAHDWQILLGRKTAAERVASLVLWLWERQGRGAEVSLHLGREGLGQLCGLTFETVSRQMKALERAGALRLPQPSRVSVLDAELLLALTGDTPRSARAA